MDLNFSVFISFSSYESKKANYDYHKLFNQNINFGSLNLFKDVLARLWWRGIESYR